VVAHGLFEDAHLSGARLRVAREKALGHGVVARVRQLDAGAPEHALEVGVWDVNQDASTVAGARIASGGAPVRETTKDLDPLHHDVVGRRSAQVGYKAESACVALKRRVVHATLGRQGHSDLEYTKVDATRQLDWRLDAPKRMANYPRCLSKYWLPLA